MTIHNPDNLPVIPPLSETPKRPADGALAICGKCGTRILPVMGYCRHMDCFLFLKVTFEKEKNT